MWKSVSARLRDGKYARAHNFTKQIEWREIFIDYAAALCLVCVCAFASSLIQIKAHFTKEIEY